MTYPVDVILGEVRTLLDEGPECAALSSQGDGEALALDRLLPVCLERAIREVETSATAAELDLSSFGDAPLFLNGAGTGGWLPLPPDFLRLGAFRLQGWARDADAVPEGSGRHMMQSSSVAAMRGTAERPVCVCATGQGGPRLEFWPWSGAVAEASYLPMRPGCTHTAEFSERLRHRITARAAELARAIVNGQAPAPGSN